MLQCHECNDHRCKPYYAQHQAKYQQSEGLAHIHTAPARLEDAIPFIIDRHEDQDGLYNGKDPGKTPRTSQRYYDQ